MVYGYLSKIQDQSVLFPHTKNLHARQRGFWETMYNVQLLCCFWLLFRFSRPFGMDNELLENRICSFFEEDLGNSAGRLSAFSNPLFSCFTIDFTCICVWIEPTKNAFETRVCRSWVFGENNSEERFLVSTSSGKSNFEHTTKEWIKERILCFWRLLFEFSAFRKEYSFLELGVIFHHFHLLSLCHLVFGREVAVARLTSELDDDSVVFFCHGIK